MHHFVNGEERPDVCYVCAKGLKSKQQRWDNNVGYPTDMFVMERGGPSFIITNSDVHQLVIIASLRVFDQTSRIIMFAKTACST